MSEESERINSIQAKNVASQTGDYNTQYNTFNEIITISVDVIKTRPFNPVSPYKGLRQFEAKPADSKHFFGRDQLIHLLLQELNNSNLLLLLGASGSGKSSVIQAGLIPRFEEKLGSNFIPFIFRPDKNPFVSLFNVLSPKYGQDKTKFILQAKENTLIKIVETLKIKDSFWLIYIDQFEEIFHLSDPDQGKKFIKALVNLYQYLQANKELSVKLVMTMRTDFLDKFSAYPKLKNITITQKHLEMIADMQPDELRHAIEQPAAQNGVVFEDGLVKEIIDDVKDQPGYLPLLQYTLDLLWKNDNIGKDKTLHISTYRTLGGVRGALQQHVEAIYQELSDGEQEAVRKIFLKLVDVERNQELGTLQKAVSKRAAMTEFKGELIQATLTKLINYNLIVSNKSQATIEAEATVEIAHEILLSSWETLRKWIEDAHQVIGIRNDLVKGLHRWQEMKKKDPNNAYKDFLTGSLLAEAREKRDSKTFDLVLGELTPEENQFIDDSYAYSERQRNEKIRTARIITAGSLVAVIISSSLGWMAWQKTRQAEFNLAHSRGFSSLSLFDQGKELEAFIEAIKAGKTLQNQHADDAEVMDALQELLNRKSEHNRLVGHNDGVSSVSFSPDGKTLATGSRDNTIKLWNVETGKEILTLTGHNSYVNSVSFSRDGKTLASGSSDKTIKLWNVQTGKEIRTLTGHNNQVLIVSFSRDGKTLASGSSDKTIKLWNVQTGKEIRTLTGHNDSVLSVSFSRDGKTLASGSGDNTIKLWNVQTGQEIRTLTGHNRYVLSVSFSRDGKTLATGNGDNTIKLWNVETGQEIRTLSGHNNYVSSVSFSRNGKTLATGNGNNKTIKLWNVETGQEIRTLSGHNNYVSSVNFSNDGKTLASGSWDNTIKLWNVETGTEIHTLKGHNSGVESVSFSSDGKTLASGSSDNTIKLWNVEARTEIHTLKGHNSSVESVSFSSDGRTLASGSYDGTIKLWNVETGQEIRTLSGDNSPVSSVSFSSDGKTLASGSMDKMIKLWNVETGKEIRTLSGHNGNVLSVSFSPDGKILASGSVDGTIKLWNGSNGWGLDALMERSCDWVRVYLKNPNSDVREEDRGLCDGIGEEK